MYCRKDRPCKFNVYGKKSELSRLPRLNACCSCRFKPSYRVFTEQVPGPFHSWPSAIANLIHCQSIPDGSPGSKSNIACLYYIVFAYVTHCKSINDNYTWIVILFFCLVVFKLCSNDFRNIKSLKNVTPQYFRTGRFLDLRPSRSFCWLAWFETYCRINAALEKIWVPQIKTWCKSNSLEKIKEGLIG